MKEILHNRKIILALCALSACMLSTPMLYNRIVKQFISTKELPINMKDALKNTHIMPIVIIGSGCAGWSAAIYAARSGIKTLLIEGPKTGGQLVGTSYVENIPGVPKSMGESIIATMSSQAKSFGALSMAEQVISVDFSQWPYTIKTDANKEIKALSIIVATGAMPKRLNIPGEEYYWGKGVTTCAICDAAFHKDHEVIVVGGGDSALEQVLQLSPYVKTINLLVRGSSLRASQAMQHHIKANPKLRILYNTHLKEIKGDGNHVKSVIIDCAGISQSMDMQGVFLAIGHEPATQLFRNSLTLDQEGYIITKGQTQHTSLAGVFAAGDVQDKLYRQAGVASGNGIKAALDAISFLQSIEFSTNYQTECSAQFFSLTAPMLGKITHIENVEEFDSLLHKTNLPVVVDCYTTWCPACKSIEKILMGLVGQFSQKALFIKINVQDNPTLAERHGINAVPELFIFKKDQKPIRYEAPAYSNVEVLKFLTLHLS